MSKKRWWAHRINRTPWHWIRGAIYMVNVCIDNNVYIHRDRNYSADDDYVLSLTLTLTLSSVENWDNLPCPRPVKIGSVLYTVTCSMLCEGNRRSQVDCPYKGQWRGALMFSFICAWTNGRANNRDGGDLRCVHYDVTVMNVTMCRILPVKPVCVCVWGGGGGGVNKLIYSVPLFSHFFQHFQNTI